MSQEGHEIGNHMMHDEASLKLSEEEFEKQLLQTQQLISRHSSPQLKTFSCAAPRSNCGDDGVDDETGSRETSPVRSASESLTRCYGSIDDTPIDPQTGESENVLYDDRFSEASEDRPPLAGPKKWFRPGSGWFSQRMIRQVCSRKPS